MVVKLGYNVPTPQVLAKTYGGVVDETDENGMNEVCISLVVEKIQRRIGQKTQEAFDLREQANLIERGTV